MISFTDLPGEIRNQIYELALIRGCISIEDIDVTFVLPVLFRQMNNDWDEPQKARFKHYMLTPPIYPLRPLAKSLASINRRSIWYHEFEKTRQVNMTISKALGRYPASSYRMVPGCCEPPVLQLFQTNKQIRSESSQIFYGRNRFVLHASACYSYPSALTAFLADREDSQMLIRRIGLTLGYCEKDDISLLDNSPCRPICWVNMRRSLKPLKISSLHLIINGKHLNDWCKPSTTQSLMIISSLRGLKDLAITILCLIPEPVHEYYCMNLIWDLCNSMLKTPNERPWPIIQSLYETYIPLYTYLIDMEWSTSGAHCQTLMHELPEAYKDHLDLGGNPPIPYEDNESSHLHKSECRFHECMSHSDQDQEYWKRLLWVGEPTRQ